MRLNDTVPHYTNNTFKMIRKNIRKLFLSRRNIIFPVFPTLWYSKEGYIPRLGIRRSAALTGE